MDFAAALKVGPLFRLRAAARVLLRRAAWLPERHELFDRPWPAGAPSVADFRASIGAERGAAHRVPASAVHLVRLSARIGAAEAARRLLTEGYVARRGVAPYPLALPIDWAADPHRDENWRVQLNMLRLVDSLIHAHEASGEAAPLAAALGFALDWHRFHETIHRSDRFVWLDMMTGVRTLRVAYLAEQVRRGAVAADESQRDALAAMLARHTQRLVEPGFFRYTNHTVWDLHGLTALLRIALPADDPRHAAWRVAIAARLDHLLALQFDERGVHRENSPHYQFVAAAMFRALHTSGWYDDSNPGLAATLAQSRHIEPWMRLPDGRCLPIGDSDGAAPSSPHVPAPSRDRDGDRIETYNASGYCFVRRIHATHRNRWSQLAIKAGFDLPGHRHADVLSHLWSESGCDIVVDPGKYSYDAGPMRQYFLGNAAHNLIRFDRRDCEADARHRTGHLVQHVTPRPWGLTITARLRHRPVAVDHERVWHFAPGRWLVVVDRFAAASPLAFEHFTHLAPEFSAQAVAGGAFDVRHADGTPLVVQHWSSVDVRAAVLRGIAGPEPQGWVSRGYRHLEPSPTLLLEGRAAHATLVFAISLDARGALQENDGDDALEWHCVHRVPLQTAPLDPTPG